MLFKQVSGEFQNTLEPATHLVTQSPLWNSRIVMKILWVSLLNGAGEKSFDSLWSMSKSDPSNDEVFTTISVVSINKALLT